MQGERRRRFIGCRPGVVGLGVSLLLSLSSCVYFNTYYNAQKYFRKAEKARLAEEQAAIATPGGDQPRRRVRRESSTSLYEQAARKASVVLEKYRDSDLVDDAMFMVGQALFWQADYTNAARSFSDLELHFPASEYADRARYWRGLCLQEQGKAAESRALLRGVFAEATPEVAAAAGFRLGELAASEEDFVAAIDEYQATVDGFPSARVRAEVLLRLGEAHLAMEDESRWDSALAAFERVASADPSDDIAYRARLNVGRVLYDKGEAAAALGVYDDLLRQAEFRAYEGETRLLVGQYYWDRQVLEKALEEYERVRDDFPQSDVSAMALYQTGLLHLREHGDLPRAREYLEEVAVEKRNSEASRLAQQSLGRLNEVDRLRAEVRRADSLAAVQDAEVRRADSLAAAQDPEIRRAEPPAVTEGSEVAPADSLAVLQDSVALRADSRTAAQDSVVFQADSLTAAQDSVVLRADSLMSAQDSVRTRAAAEPATPTRRSRRGGSRGRDDPTESLPANLFSLAEIYRDELAVADSSVHYYQQLLLRFPESLEVPRILYSLAWVKAEMQGDGDAGRDLFQQLIERFPETEHARAARQRLGLETGIMAADLAEVAFEQLEKRWAASGEPQDEHVPGLDSLASAFPGTPAAARAAYLAASHFENAIGDTAEAWLRYDRLAEEHPGSPVADLVLQRRESQLTGVLDKLERELASVGRSVEPGERIRVIAVQPDSADTSQQVARDLGFALRAHRRGHWETASELYEYVLEAEPQNARALYGLGDVAWQGGYFEDGVDYLRQALRSTDRSAGMGACYRLFAYHTRDGLVDSANHYLREVMRRDGDSPDVHDVRTDYPDVAGAEPRDLEMSSLTKITLEPTEKVLETSIQSVGLREPPLVRRSVTPPYPGGTDSARVVVDILVSEEGEPEEVLVFSGEEPFASAAEAAAREYVFFPAEDGRGDQRRVWVELVLAFAPEPASAVEEEGVQ